VKRGLLVAVGGAAIVVAGLSGCSSSEKSSSSSSSAPAMTSGASSSESASASASANSGTGTAKVSIDGQDQNVSGSVMCAEMGGNVNIAVGQGTTGLAAVVSSGDSPTATSVALGNVNGVTLAVGPGAGDAKVEKDGKTYKISGNATGIDMANPMAPVTKPFTFEVTCP
jgi:lipoprotein LpqH